MDTRILTITRVELLVLGTTTRPRTPHPLTVAGMDAVLGNLSHEMCTSRGIPVLASTSNDAIFVRPVGDIINR